jgi:hypothetical protein
VKSIMLHNDIFFVIALQNDFNIVFEGVFDIDVL